MTETISSAARREASAWVRDHGEHLLRYALPRVPDPNVAEDLVQETYLAALRGWPSFGGQSSVRTWLISILRRKLADYYRRQMRRSDAPDRTVDVTSPFDDRGIWKAKLKKWPRSAAAEMEDQEFWQVLQQCLSALPATAMSAFALRVMDDLRTDEVCEALEITAKNLSVRLHRARLALRECLGRRWFGEPPRDGSHGGEDRCR